MSFYDKSNLACISKRESGGLVSAHVQCHWDTADIPAFETELQQSISSDCLNFDIKM